MKVLVLIILLSGILSLDLVAQKKPLDHSVYDSWEHIDAKLISPDGQWVAYSIAPQVGPARLIVQNPVKGFKTEVSQAYNAAFTEDSSYLVYGVKPAQREKGQAGDSLMVLDLSGHTIWKIAGVSSFHLARQNSDWLAYRLKDTPSDITLRHLSSGWEGRLDGVAKFEFSARSNKLLLVSGGINARSVNSLALYDLDRQTVDTVWRGNEKIAHFVMTDDAGQVALLLQSDDGTTSIRHYVIGKDRNRETMIDRHTTGMPNKMAISTFQQLYFSPSGNRLFFGLTPALTNQDNDIKKDEKIDVDIWRYDEYPLKSSREEFSRFQLDRPTSYLSLFDFTKGAMVQLGTAELPLVRHGENTDSDLFFGRARIPVEIIWMGDDQPYSFYAISPQNGSKALIVDSLPASGLSFSPNGKYIYWYDKQDQNYFTWDGQQVRNITSRISEPLYSVNHDQPYLPASYGVMGWHEDDSFLYLYDQYDIWKVDPLAQSEPVNVTRSYGRENKIVIRAGTKSETQPFTDSDMLLLKIYREEHKDSGLAMIRLKDYKFTMLPILDRSIYVDQNGWYVDYINQANHIPASIIYTRENYASSPDLYYAVINFENGTTSETRLSAINPQQAAYNWGTTELVKWMAFNGKQAEGILYKPEDFDPARQYPMICYYYQRLDDQLNRYIAPQPIRGSINISYFVSNGYLVFCPNIEYEVGQPCQDVYDYVVSGTEELIGRGYVDAANIGIQGASFGGYQTLCLITQTQLFKVAWASSVISNLVSFYGNLFTSGSNHARVERGQNRTGTTVWDHPDIYIKNSPVFHLKNVTTPLMLLANDHDFNTHSYQGIEMFMGLRRLQKRVWLLNYKGETHSVLQRKNQRDLQIRMQEFFDYFLKGQDPPIWLNERDSEPDLTESQNNDL